MVINYMYDTVMKNVKIVNGQYLTRSVVCGCLSVTQTTCMSNDVLKRNINKDIFFKDIKDVLKTLKKNNLKNLSKDV